MNPIPVSWCAAGGLGLAVLGAWGGWTVRDWKRDSEVLAGVEAASKKLDAARVAVDNAATAYEQEKQDAAILTNTRESTIREIYKDRPVPADCALPDAAHGVLQDAVRDANARASGEPSATVQPTGNAAGERP